MIKKVNWLFLLMLILSCSSSDDTTEQTPTQNSNGFNFNGSFFSISNLYLNDENIIDSTPSDLAIILSNVDLFQGNVNSGVNFIYIDFNGVTFQEGTISNILDYRIGENMTLNNLMIEGGNTILDDTESGLMASNSSLTINSINASEISLSFSFTREDGQVINGSYIGTYSDISE